MPVRGKANCSMCGSDLIRVLWNYGKNRPILEFFCDNKCKGAWQRLQRENLGFTKEWLYNEYHVKHKGANEIAREIGRDAKRVWEWIRDYGLETRPRGNEYGRRFKKGDVSPFLGKKHSEAFKQKKREERLKDGHVPYLKNGIHWLKHEGAVSPNWKGGISPERAAFYGTEEWKNAVKAVWKRDKAICQKCGKNHNEESARGSFHIHHIVSFMVKTLRADPGNLVLLCKSCHRWVHSRNNTQKLFIREVENV